MMWMIAMTLIVASTRAERGWTRMEDHHHHHQKEESSQSSSQSSFLGGAKTRNVHALRTFFSKIDFDNDGQLDAEELKKYVAQAIGGIEFDEREEIESASEETIKQMDKQSDDDETISNVELTRFVETNENVATARDVKLWVKYALRFPQYAGRFEENRITIDDFPSLIMNDGELLKSHLFVENELHKASILRNLKRQMLHLGETPSAPKKAIAKVIVPRKQNNKENSGEHVVSVKWLDPDRRGTPPAHLFVVKSVIVTPGPLAVSDRTEQWRNKEEEEEEEEEEENSSRSSRSSTSSDNSNKGGGESNDRRVIIKEWKIEEVVEWGEENALIVRNCPKEATIKFKVIAYGAFGASKAAITNEVKIPSGRRSSSSLGVGNENTSSKYNGVNRGNNAVIIEDQTQTFLSMFWSAMAILASTGGVLVRLYYLAKSWKQRNDFKTDLDGSDVSGGTGNPNDYSSIDSDDVSIDAAVGIAAKSPQKAVSALIKRAEKQLLDSSRELIEPEAEPPSPKCAASNACSDNNNNNNNNNNNAAAIADRDEKINKTVMTPPRSASPRLNNNVTNGAETTPSSKLPLRTKKRNGSNSSSMSEKSLNAAATLAKTASQTKTTTAKPTSSAQSQSQSQTTTTTTTTTIKKGICAHPFCSKKVKGLFKSPNAHYCGFCQHKFCFSHVATSPHGARGKCMPESECVCMKCFNALDEKKQKSLLKNSDVLHKPEIVERLDKKEKAAKRWKMIKNVMKVRRMAEKRMAYARSQEEM